VCINEYKFSTTEGHFLSSPVTLDARALPPSSGAQREWYPGDPKLLWPSFFFFFFLKIYLFIICKYTVVVFRYTRRGHQISLRVVVSHHVVAGIWTSDLRKSSRVPLPTEPSHQPRPCLFSTGITGISHSVWFSFLY
jgi:hypothetical protein